MHTATHKNRTSALAVSLAAIFTLTLTACGDKPAEQASAPTATPAPAASAQPQAEPETSAPPTPAKAPDVQEQQASSSVEKVNVYIDCFNGTFGRAQDAMTRYSSWVKDMKAGPTGKERIVYGTYTVSSHAIERCTEPVLSAASAQPAMPELDQAARDYSATLVAWGKTLVEADKYYEREDYKDDAMAKGKAMHPEIVKNYEAYAAATKRFSEALEAENDKLHLAQLADIEKSQGRTFPWWHGMTMFQAKKAVDVLGDDKVDLAKAQARFKEFEDTADGLIEFAKQPNAKAPMMWSLYEHQLEQYRIAAKQRLRSLRDKGGATGFSGEGSAEKVVEAYNQLIQTSNQLR